MAQACAHSTGLVVDATGGQSTQWWEHTAESVGFLLGSNSGIQGMTPGLVGLL